MKSAGPIVSTNTVSVYGINQDTGALTEIGTPVSMGAMRGIVTTG